MTRRRPLSHDQSDPGYGVIRPLFHDQSDPGYGVMALRPRWRGTGLTKRMEFILDLPPDGTLPEYLQYATVAEVFEGQMNRAETWARDILAKAGHKVDELDSTKTLFLITRKADEDGKADSAEDFAGRILTLILEVRAAIKHGNASVAAHHAMQLGEEITRAVMKKQHEATWETGDKQRRALGSTRAKVNADRHAEREREWARWDREAARLWDKHHTSNAVARIVKIKLDIPDGIRTIARRLKKPG